MPSEVCALCKAPISRPEEMWCFGCKHFICEKHVEDAWGSHDIYDHDHAYCDPEGQEYET